MSNAIGKAALILGTDSTAMQAGLQKAEKDVFNFGEKVKDTVEKKSFGKLGSIAGKAGGLAGSALNKGMMAGLGTTAGGLAGGLGTKLLGPVGLILGGVAGASSMIDDLKNFAQMSKSAKALGMDGGQYMGLAQMFKRAGIEGDGFTATLGKLQGKVSMAANGNAELAKSFAEIGIDAAQLQNLPVDEQLKAIADGMKKVGNEGDQSRIALKLFEEGGLKLLPMLQKGGKGVQDFIDQQKKLGTALDGKQLAAAERAAAAMPKLSASLEGFKNKITIAMAPILERWATFGTAILNRLQPVFDWIAKVYTTIAEIVFALQDKIFDALGKWGSQLVEWIQSLTGSETELRDFKEVAWEVAEAVFKSLSHMATKVAQAFGWTVNKAGNAIEWLGNAMEKIGLEEWGKAWQEAGKGVAEWGDKVHAKWKGWDAMQAGANFTADLKQRLAEREAELEKAAARDRARKEEMARTIDPNRLVTTIKRDTSEAWKLEATWKNGQMFGQDKQLKEAQKANKLLEGIFEQQKLELERKPIQFGVI